MGFIRDGNFSVRQQPVLTDVPAGITTEVDPTGSGVFLRVKGPGAQGAARWEMTLGRPRGKRFAACYRNEPFWMRPAAGQNFGRVPVETQVLFTESAEGRVVV